MPRKDKTLKYNYLIDYINEAVLARETLSQICARTILAYKQCPSHNTYKENAYSYQQNIANSDPAVAQCIRQLCDSIPTSTNDTVFNAVETFVSMAMGGASQFEYSPSDEFAEKDPDLVDRLSALAKYFHDDNKIDTLVAKATRKMIMQGQANFFLEPIKDGRFKVSLIDAYKMLQDPRASKTNCARYIGYTEVQSWSQVKGEIYKKYDGYFIKVINEVDQYLRAIQGGNYGGIYQEMIMQDLDTFGFLYSNTTPTSKSVNKEGEEVSPKEPGYKGDDVEVSYIYDLLSNVYAIIINRRFIVHLEEDKLKKNIKHTYYDADGEEKTRTTTVRVDSPFVTMPFIEADWETYPVSPLFYCLDDFDAICSIESVMNHNLSIMAPITFFGANYDSEQMSKVSQVAGQIVEGTLQTFGVLNKQHDMSPCISAIERREQRIKRMLGATDQFELQAMIGNRASAAEASVMAGAVSQRMNAPLANIETAMSELVQKMFAMVLIYGDKDEFVFSADGSTQVVTKEDLLGRATIRARLASRIKVEQEQQSRNALMVLQALLPLEGMDKDNLVKTLVPIITRGVVTRRQAESFIGQPQQDVEAIFEAQTQLQEQAQQENPAMIPPEMLQGISPQDMEEISGAYSASFEQQPTIDTGVDNYQAGVEQNEPLAGLPL